MTPSFIAKQIARCDQEILEMETQEATKPAYLTTLGIEDWKAERRILELHLPLVCPFCFPDLIAAHHARPGRTCSNPCSYKETL